MLAEVGLALSIFGLAVCCYHWGRFRGRIEGRAQVMGWFKEAGDV